MQIPKHESNTCTVNDKLVDCRKEGGCNFTTIGGVFELLGVAVFSHRGCYRKS